MKSPLALLAGAEIPLLLVGGTAVQAYGFSRLTKDFDCVISKAKMSALADLLTRNGFVAFHRSAVVERYRNPETGWVIDALLVPEATFSKMWEKRREMRLGDRLLPIAAPLHLIAMKLHSVRHNPSRKLPDLVDMLELIRRERSSFSRKELENACEHYGTAEITAILLEAYDQRGR